MCVGKEKLMKEDTMIPIPAEPAQVDVSALTERLDKLEKDNRILKETVSKQRQLEAEARLDKDTSQTAQVRLWKGVPIIARKTVKNEHIMNPITGLPTAQGNTTIDLKLANGEIVKEITIQQLNAISQFTGLKQKELRQVRDYELWGGERDIDGQVWIAEWVDSIIQSEYGDVEINVRYLNT